VWETKGKLVYKVASLPLADQVPIDGVIAGPRAVRWRPDEPATLVWVKALDNGDPKKKVAHRDSILLLKAPFTGQPTGLFKTENRFSGMNWGERDGLVFISDFERDKRWTRTFMPNANKPEIAAKMIWSRNNQDRYNDLRASGGKPPFLTCSILYVFC
jgi:hypothetical protein